MDYYELLSHGTRDFPVGIHHTRCDQGFVLYPHMHKEFEFLVLTQGCGIMQIDGEPCKMEAGSAVFIRPESLHLGNRVDENCAQFFAVVFSPEILGSFGEDLIMNKYVLPVLQGGICFPKIYSARKQWQREVIDMLNRIYEEHLGGGAGYELKVKGLLLEIWRECFLHSEKTAARETPAAVESIKQAFSYIRAEYASPISLDDIAKHVHMSKSYFCHLFSEIVHMSPFEYILSLRIQSSCRMLQSSALPIGEIAQKCGFNSFSYFSKTFRNAMGCTPRDYMCSFRNRDGVTPSPRRNTEQK